MNEQITLYYDTHDFTFRLINKLPVPYYSIVKSPMNDFRIGTIEYNDNVNVFCLNIQTDKLHFTPREVAQLYKILAQINTEYFESEVIK